MRLIPVNSSNLVAVGYDENSSTLTIEFHSGTYDYYNVPKSVYNSLLNAPSKGEYHHQHIKNNYLYNKVG